FILLQGCEDWRIPGEKHAALVIEGRNSRELEPIHTSIFKVSAWTWYRSHLLTSIVVRPSPKSVGGENTLPKGKQVRLLALKSTLTFEWLYQISSVSISRVRCTPMFIAALFTIAKTWNQPTCPETDDWIKKMWYIYTMEYYSAIKK
uniref:Uncharacterized protein n=1 Tax=Equus asinus TaxID=9793 RepID=A0A9L0INY8_EQUAS